MHGRNFKFFVDVQPRFAKSMLQEYHTFFTEIISDLIHIHKTVLSVDIRAYMYIQTFEFYTIFIG
jgi:N-acetylglucosamine-6-phosphate deacetylase